VVAFLTSSSRSCSATTCAAAASTPGASRRSSASRASRRAWATSRLRSFSASSSDPSSFVSVASAPALSATRSSSAAASARPQARERARGGHQSIRHLHDLGQPEECVERFLLHVTGGLQQHRELTLRQQHGGAEGVLSKAEDPCHLIVDLASARDRATRALED